MSSNLGQSRSDQIYTITRLRRMARSTRLKAARAAPLLAKQLNELAVIIENEAEQIERADRSVAA
jgi:hypothetical protein